MEEPVADPNEDNVGEDESPLLEEENVLSDEEDKNPAEEEESEDEAAEPALNPEPEPVEEEAPKSAEPEPTREVKRKAEPAPMRASLADEIEKNAALMKAVVAKSPLAPYMKGGNLNSKFLWRSTLQKLNSICVSEIKPYVDKAIPFIAGAAVIVDKVIFHAICCQ